MFIYIAVTWHCVHVSLLWHFFRSVLFFLFLLSLLYSLCVSLSMHFIPQRSLVFASFYIPTALATFVTLSLLLISSISFELFILVSIVLLCVSIFLIFSDTAILSIFMFGCFHISRFFYLTCCDLIVLLPFSLSFFLCFSNTLFLCTSLKPLLSLSIYLYLLLYLFFTLRSLLFCYCFSISPSYSWHYSSSSSFHDNYFFACLVASWYVD